MRTAPICRELGRHRCRCGACRGSESSTIVRPRRNLSSRACIVVEIVPISVPNRKIPEMVTIRDSSLGPQLVSVAIGPGSITRSTLYQNRSATVRSCSVANAELVATRIAVLTITTSSVSDPTASSTGHVPRSQMRSARYRSRAPKRGWLRRSARTVTTQA